MPGAIAEDARSRPTRTGMFCEAGAVRIQPDARVAPDIDPRPLVQRVKQVTTCRVHTGVIRPMD